MCGIAGIIQKNKAVDKELMTDMLEKISHRGPDDEGVWVGKNNNVIFGQKRLSIIDLSVGGHQPMVSLDGNFAITFNGEIYNYKEIKEELAVKGWEFKSESDTEVLLYSYMQWGEECLHKLNGMFAFAIWDEKNQKLFAVRDRLGEKPFKYYFNGEKFIFASELKAILCDKEIKREIDWQAVDLAMTYRYVPAPWTGFKNIYKLPAGHKLILENGKLEIKSYWRASDYARENDDLSLDEWKDKIWATFKNSVSKRMISDVPVGAFLSGGLDSSSVVAAMSEVANKKVNTFSVGFKNQPDSETPFAKIVADYFKTEHTEIIIDPQIIDILPKLVRQYEEPFFDNSAVPTMAMSEKTKKFVTVVLTGDGGDECFGGYPNHTFYKYLKIYQKIPKIIYAKFIPLLLGVLAKIFNNKKLNKLFYRSELLSHKLNQAYVDYYGIWQKEFEKSKFYITKRDLYKNGLLNLIDIDLSEKLMADWLGDNKEYGDINKSALADISSRLPDNYLMKVDFGSMFYALETRPPFLDYRLIELVLSLPAKYKVKNGSVKWIWKEIIKDKLPKEIIERKKMGFGIPIIKWMRNELFDYLKEKLLVEDSLIYEYFNKNIVEKLIMDHKNGVADYSNHIWSILLLKLWVDEFFTYEHGKN